MSQYTYSHTIGLASFEGRGFMNPVDARFARDGNLYVLSRSNAGNKNVRISVVTLDSDFQFEFANWGEEPGQVTQPTSFDFGPDDRVYLADEYINTVTVFEKDGTFVDRWGEQGDGPGQFNRPSGVAIDSDGNLRVVDHLNARIQTYTPEGRYISSFGTFGTGPGEFNFPWGISIDAKGCIWVADWRNDRIQRLSPAGEFLSAFGSTGDGDGEFNRPSAVHFGLDGLVYVSDWRNDRVQVFDPDGSHRETLVGHATLSKWCQEFVDVNPEQASWRENSGMAEREKLFWRPAGIDTSPEGLVVIADSCRHRVQIYSRVAEPALV